MFMPQIKGHSSNSVLRVDTVIYLWTGDTENLSYNAYAHKSRICLYLSKFQ